MRFAASAALVLATLTAGCGSDAARREARALAQARASSRPIGADVRFHQPPPQRSVRACRATLGARKAAHVEVFALGRVVLLPAGIGTEPPRRLVAGRIVRARCYGAVVTLDRTGLVLVRRRGPRTIGDLFDAWGEPLTSRRIAGFRGRGATRVRAFVGGRPWERGSPRAIPLSPRAVIVLELGAYVPPHARYAFPRR